MPVGSQRIHRKAIAAQDLDDRQEGLACKLALHDFEAATGGADPEPVALDPALAWSQPVRGTVCGICEAGSPPKKQTQNVFESAASATSVALIVASVAGEARRKLQF